MVRLLNLLASAGVLASGAVAVTSQTCKTTPFDAEWPSIEEWSALNTSISGALLKTSPVASSCYNGNPFNSTTPCEDVEENWVQAPFHAELPESIDNPLYANNSCLPPGATGYTEQKGCDVGALPQYIVNATSEAQVAAAMVWAAERNIRIVVKGTGHDMNGRSSGAYSMSVWTHNFNNIKFNSVWPLPGSNGTADVLIAGSGNNWISIYTAAELVGKAVVGGGAKTVGLGGFIQGGGHGPMSSHYGLAADQILQATVITTEGEILVANGQQNQDLLWAIRGGGAGQYGVVTEYVLKVYPAPSSAILGTLTLSTNGTSNSSISAVWNAFAVEVSSMPDLMDLGLTGQLTAITSQPAAGGATVSVTHQFIGYNMTADDMSAMLKPVVANMQAEGDNATLLVEWSEPVAFANFTSLFDYLNPSQASAGGGSLMSSRLLGRDQLSTNITQSQVLSYLQQLLLAPNSTGGYMILGMQGGQGPANVPRDMRGALNPVWRTTYLHAISLGASIDTTADPKTALTSAAEWINLNEEPIWREWAPDMGAYMNEANPYNPEFKHDYYGASYDMLLEIKKKYDPTESLFVLTGVGSDGWDYDLNTGKLCRTG